MSDVEFLHPDEPALEPTTGAAAAPKARSRASDVAVVLAVIGAGLAVAAPFQTAYRLTVPTFGEDGGRPNVISLDGWGRYGAASALDDIGRHGPRVGIVYCVAAAMALIGVASWGLAEQRRNRIGHRLRRASAGTGAVLFGAGAVLAVAASTVLDVVATVDSYRASIQGFYDSDGGAPSRPTSAGFTPGPMIWFSVASAVVLVAAVVVRVLSRPSRKPEIEPGPVPEIVAERPSPPLVHRDDEVLD